MLDLFPPKQKIVGESSVTGKIIGETDIAMMVTTYHERPK